MLHSAACDCGAVHAPTRDKARAPKGFIKARRLEEAYAVQLRRIAHQVGIIIETWAPEDQVFDLSKVPALKSRLDRYAEVIGPWASATAGRIVEEVAIKERRFWAEHAREMSLALRQEIRNAPTGAVLRAMLDQEVDNITSIPRVAAERVYDLTLKGLENSTRASQIAAEIMRSGEVAASRATMLARTSISTTASSLVRARAQHIGSTGYAWRTSRDSDVRPSHARMEGRIVEWDKPPTIDGYTAHAGCFANCRCWPEPILPEW